MHARIAPLAQCAQAFDLLPLQPFVDVLRRNGRLRLARERIHAHDDGLLRIHRALAYILANGPDGLRQTTEDAVLNANYVRAQLEDTFELPFKTRTLHEVVFSDKLQAKNGVRTGDMAKRLIDFGFHPYTVSFPMIVSGALMIEPTESESKEELDLLVDALKQIAREAEENPDYVKNAPHTTRLSRLDETAAARKPVLRWQGPAEPVEAATPAKEW